MWRIHGSKLWRIDGSKLRRIGGSKSAGDPVNLVVLLQRSYDENRRELKANVLQALDTLKHESYVTRDGDNYRYLSDDEKSLENQIMSSSLEQSDLNKELSDLFFINVLENTASGKIKDKDFDDDYEFVRMLNGEKTGGKGELSINLLTEMDPDKVRQYAEPRQLCVVLPNNSEYRDFTDDLITYLKTYAFLNLHAGTQEGIAEELKNDKAKQNEKLKQSLKGKLSELVSKAHLFYRGEDLSADDTSNPKKTVTDAFLKMVSKEYYFRDQIKDLLFSEKDISSLLTKDPYSTDLLPAEKTVLDKLRNNNGTNPTIEDLISDFSKIPYGFKRFSTIGILAMLYERRLISFIQSNRPLTDQKQLTDKLENSREIKNISVKNVKAVSQESLQRIHSFIKDYFDVPAPSISNQQELFKKFKQQFKERSDEVSDLLNRSDAEGWPLDEQERDDLRLICEKNSKLQEDTGDEYIHEVLPDSFEILTNSWNERLKSLVTFKNNTKMCEVFRDARAIVSALGLTWTPHKSEHSSALEEKFKTLKTSLKDPKFYINIRQLNSDLSAFKRALADECDALTSELLKSIDEIKSDYEQNDERFKKLDDKAQSKFSAFFDNERAELTSSLEQNDSRTNLTGLYSSLSRKIQSYKPTLSGRADILLSELANPVVISAPASDQPSHVADIKPGSEASNKQVAGNSNAQPQPVLGISKTTATTHTESVQKNINEILTLTKDECNKPVLRNTEDVEDFVDRLKAHLMAEIEHSNSVYIG